MRQDYDENDNDSVQRFHFFFDNIVPYVTGLRKWGRKKKTEQLISESEVSITDEAFSIIMIENYFETWKEDYNPKVKDDNTKKIISTP